MRLLNRRPHIVVATPGRLWKLIKEVCLHAIINSSPFTQSLSPSLTPFPQEEHHHLCELQQLQFFVLDEADRMIEHGHFMELSLLVERIMATRPKSSRTFVFSATLTLPRRRMGRGGQRSVSRQQTLGKGECRERGGGGQHACFLPFSSLPRVLDDSARSQ